MTHHLIPHHPSASQRTPRRSPPHATETVSTVLDLHRRIQFVQRLAVLIRRMHNQPRLRGKEGQAHES